MKLLIVALVLLTCGCSNRNEIEVKLFVERVLSCETSINDCFKGDSLIDLNKFSYDNYEGSDAEDYFNNSLDGFQLEYILTRQEVIKGKDYLIIIASNKNADIIEFNFLETNNKYILELIDFRFIDVEVY
jgi:hypothetical protein